MDWKNFTPDPAKAEALRPVVLFLNGEDPFAPVVPIDTSNVTVRKCDKCGATIPFISSSATCPGGCEGEF